MAVRRKNSDEPAFPSWIGLLRQAADELRSEQMVADANLVEAFLSVDPPEVLAAARTAHDKLQQGGRTFS
jgi:hypothetical protein